MSLWLSIPRPSWRKLRKSPDPPIRNFSSQTVLWASQGLSHQPRVMPLAAAGRTLPPPPALPSQTLVLATTCLVMHKAHPKRMISEGNPGGEQQTPSYMVTPPTMPWGSGADLGSAPTATRPARWPNTLPPPRPKRGGYWLKKKPIARDSRIAVDTRDLAGSSCKIQQPPQPFHPHRFSAPINAFLDDPQVVKQKDRRL